MNTASTQLTRRDAASTSPCRSVRALGILVLIILAGSLVMTHGVAPTRAGEGSAAGQRTAASAPGVVCFGHVDVEPGITSLFPIQPGRVERVFVTEGQEVKAGTVLLSLDKRLTEALVKQARADLEAARVQVDQAKVALPQQAIKEAEQQAVIDAVRFRGKAAEWLLARKEELRDIQSGEKELEAGRMQGEELKAILRGEEKKLEELKLNDPALILRKATADMTAKQARLEQATVALEECELRAPTEGTVLRLLASAGDVLSCQPRQPAILFCPRGPRIIRAEVEQEFAGRVEMGQSAVIEDDANNGVSWRGQVQRISDWYTHRRSIIQEPLQLNDTRTLECIIEVAPGQPPLRIGQRVRVMIGESK